VSNSKSDPVVIALCGKGGVGKTSLSAMLTKLFAENTSSRILSIDADPALGLGTALGVSISRTVNDIRDDMIERIKKGDIEDKQAYLSALDYEMFDAIAENKNIAFLAIGRPENEGCYCSVNEILKDIITIMAQSFDYIIIDGEAGIEQINRRVMEQVTHLLLVSDASIKGLHVASTIKTVADKTMHCQSHGLILNRINKGEEKNAVSIPADLDYLGWIPEDPTVRAFDIHGKSFLDIDECLAMTSIRKYVRDLMHTVQ
jgi:CO dehydrogenase maturation factor